MPMALRPIGDRVICRVCERPEKEGLIVVPDAAKGRVDRAIVIAVGSGRPLKNGGRAAPSVAPGDVVIFDPYKVLAVPEGKHPDAVATPIAEPGEVFLISSQHILAVEE